MTYIIPLSLSLSCQFTLSLSPSLSLSHLPQIGTELLPQGVLHDWKLLG